ncbi:MAG: 1-(5-phosphoribosyl)-5-((5-phosphoribosylamino)methylideneamino) imidazole-4-carboxamide isomerase [Syntrophaceae bacterium PtaU1.Bin231]|nr:MAG: 1-(5-phosphoribosyl)-5-((5-phosphoribosylamino)methylideneamino) imidazole-4-carboxamide isomerase [Syntrophaceae bacterium PtaU1.Bin231]
MIIIPAIDIKEGRCVRLLQGDFQRVTVFSNLPVEMAKIWESKGAERIHVVDLDGSVAGEPRNEEVIRAIAEAVSVPIQVGGGIRSMKTIDRYLDMGVRWVILGTAALRDEAMVRGACREHPDSVILAVDARDGGVAVQGWTEKTGVSAVELMKRYRGIPFAAVVYTDIRRDGMETGANIAQTEAFARAVDIPVIASGGVAGVADIEALIGIEESGVIGVVVGRALYTGALSLETAMSRARKALP